jgi:hypothetical protein
MPLLEQEGWPCRQEKVPKASLYRHGRGGQAGRVFRTDVCAFNGGFAIYLSHYFHTGSSKTDYPFFKNSAPIGGTIRFREKGCPWYANS